MRKRLQGIMGVMFLIIGSLLIVAGPASAVDDQEPQAPVLDETDDTVQVEIVQDEVVKDDDKVLDQDQKDELQDKKDEASDPVEIIELIEDDEPTILIVEELYQDDVFDESDTVDDGKDEEKVLDEDQKEELQDKKDDASDPKADDEEGEVVIEREVIELDRTDRVLIEQVLIVEELVQEEVVETVKDETKDDDKNDGDVYRVCHVQDQDHFSYNTVLELGSQDAGWHLKKHAGDTKMDRQNEGGDCPSPAPVKVCQFDGLDYKLVSVHPSDANWMLAQGDAVLLNGKECPIRVCHFDDTANFSYWKPVFADADEANWYISTYEKDTWAPKGKPCPGNDDVKVCHLIDGEYKLMTVTPDVGNWFLSLDNDDTVPNADGKCPKPPVEEPTPEPTTEPTPEVKPEPTPVPEVVIPVIVEKPEEPVVVDEAEEKDEKVVATPEVTDDDDDDDAEVLAKTVTKTPELAVTGAESTQLALYGLALILGGVLLIGTSRFRRITL